MHIPFGYELNNGKLEPNLSDLELLERAAAMVSNGISLREASNWLNYKASGNISHEGLKKRIAKGIYTHGGSLLAERRSETDASEETIRVSESS